MNAFVDLSRDSEALQRLLCDNALARPGDKTLVRLLGGGVSGNIFVAQIGSEKVCIKQALPQLKVSKEWLAPVSRVFAEIEWLRSAADLIPGHVPKVIAVDETNRAFVMEYLPAEEYSNWKTALLSGIVDITVGQQLGDLLGRMHSGTADVGAARRFPYGANFFALRLDPYFLETARVHPDLAPQLISLVHAIQNHAYAVVHGDVSPKNVLVGKQGLVLLDAECAYFGDPAFDLAFLLNHVLLKSIKLPSIADDCAALFNAIVAAYLPHVSWEDVSVFESRVSALLPGLMLARVDGKSPVEYLDERHRSSVRRISRNLLSQRPESLEDLRNSIQLAL